MHDGGHRGEPVDPDGRDGAERGAGHAAGEGENHRLGQHLEHDVAPAGAERLPQADFLRPFGDRHQHDVHDDDAGDHHGQADDPHEDREDAGGRLLKEAERGVRGEDPEVVFFVRPEPPLDPQRDGGLADGRVDPVRVGGLHPDAQGRPGAEQALKGAERNDRELVLRHAEGRADRTADPDDAKRHPLDADLAVDRVERLEQPFRRFGAEHRDIPSALDFGWRHQAAVLGVEGGEVDEVVGHALNGDLLEQPMTVPDLAGPLRLDHHGGDLAGEAADRVGVVHRDARVVPRPFELLLAPDDAAPVDHEGVRAHLRQDDVGHLLGNPLDEGYEGDDRRDGDDVSENCQERPEFVGPDRAQRDPDHLTDQGRAHWAPPDRRLPGCARPRTAR